MREASMNHAGVDAGCSLTKVAFRTGFVYDNDETWFFRSTADRSPEMIAKELMERKINELNVCGINKLHPAFNNFVINRLAGDPIATEIKLQARGARKLLHIQGHKIKEFLLVSIGTGTSYTFVKDKSETRFPIGNSLGGGFLRGLSHLLHISINNWNPSKSDLEKLDSLDFLVQNILPETEKTPLGRLLVSNFGNVRPDSPITDGELARALINTVAVAVSRDIAMLQLIGNLTKENKILGLLGLLMKMSGLTKHGNVVIIGTTVEKCGALRELLGEHCERHLKLTPIFPQNASYALAMGSYLMKK